MSGVVAFNWARAFLNVNSPKLFLKIRLCKTVFLFVVLVSEVFGLSKLDTDSDTKTEF